MITAFAIGCLLTSAAWAVVVLSFAVRRARKTPSVSRGGDGGDATSFFGHAMGGRGGDAGQEGFGGRGGNARTIR